MQFGDTDAGLRRKQTPTGRDNLHSWHPFGRSCKFPPIGQLSTKVQATAKCEDIAQCCVANLRLSREFKGRFRPGEKLRATPVGASRRKDEHSVHILKNARDIGLASDVKGRSFMSERTEIDVAGKKLKVSNLSKVLYPEVGFTKAQVIDYYIRIAPVLLPHLKRRPITLKRYPNGVDGFFFYEKRCPSHRPSWVKTATVLGSSEEKRIDYCMMEDLPALVWAANLADLELHTFLHRAPAITRPLTIAFDLDPGPPADICTLLSSRVVAEKHS